MAQYSQRNSFVQGAVILSVASITSRVIGLGYRFILPWLMGSGSAGAGAYGVGLFDKAYTVFVFMLSLTSVGIPLAIAKLIAEYEARSQRKSSERVFKLAFWSLAALGLAASLLVFLGASFISRDLLFDVRATTSVRAIAPAIFLVSLLSAYRGFFQGHQRMVPYGVSQVIEQLVRVPVMLVLVYLLVPRGQVLAAGGAAFSTVIGELFGLAYLLWIYRSFRQQEDRFSAGEGLLPVLSSPASTGDQVADQVSIEPSGAPSTGPDQGPASYRLIIQRIVRLGFPIALAATIFPVIRIIDASVGSYRLQSVFHLTSTQTTTLFAYLNSYSMPFLNLPAAITTALSVSIVPAVAELAAVHNVPGVQRRILTAFRLSVIATLPMAVGILVLGPQIMGTVFSTTRPGAVMRGLAAAALFFPLHQTASGVLQGLERPGLSLRNLAFGTLTKLVLSWFLIPYWQVVGLALATSAGFFVSAGLNMLSIRRLAGAVISWRDGVFKPTISVAVMAIVVYEGYRLFHLAVGLRLATALAIALGAVVYLAMLVWTGGLWVSDLRMIPRYGDRLARAAAERNWLPQR